MKTLTKNAFFAAALVLATAASAGIIATAGNNAGVIATAGNNAGGSIKLTNEPCRVDFIALSAPAALAMYTTSASGGYTNGCWAMNDDGDIIVLFENGASRMYGVADFEIKAPPAKKPAAKRHRSDL